MRGRGEPCWDFCSAAYHFGEATGRDDVAGVDEAVEVTGGLFNLFAHFVVAVEIEDVVHKIESVLVVVDFRVEAGQVEAICHVFLVDLAKVFIAPGRDELVENLLVPRPESWREIKRSEKIMSKARKRTGKANSLPEGFFHQKIQVGLENFHP